MSRNGPTGGTESALVERLDRTDALDIDTRTVDDRQLADLETATDKARRDAGNIAVCEL